MRDTHLTLVFWSEPDCAVTNSSLVWGWNDCGTSITQPLLHVTLGLRALVTPQIKCCLGVLFFLLLLWVVGCCFFVFSRCLISHTLQMCPAIAGKQNCLPCCALWLPYLICCQCVLSKMDFLSCTDVVFSCLCLWTIFHWLLPFLWGFVCFCLLPAVTVGSQTL